MTASFGSSTAGLRGTVRVVFINNTPHRAVFTYGTYDQTSPAFAPDFAQFGPLAGDNRLDGDATSAIVSLNCARVFAIGSPRLLSLLEANVPAENTIDDALVRGVEFFRVDTDDAGDEVLVSQGSAPPFEALLGVDFPCNSLLIVRFEIADVGAAPFRVDFELIPSASTR
ncbi:MAG: hypothetical protein HY763_04125 [Planctomycetes bacterium]|nr:hypothetical protein [Planctomycetota bacterium]